MPGDARAAGLRGDVFPAVAGWPATGGLATGALRGDWLRGHRRPGSRWLGCWWLGPVTRWTVAGSGPSSTFTSGSGGKLAGGWWCGARAGQLRGTWLEPVGHGGLLSGTGANPILDLVAVDARTRARTRR